MPPPTPTASAGGPLHTAAVVAIASASALLGCLLTASLARKGPGSVGDTSDATGHSSKVDGGSGSFPATPSCDHPDAAQGGGYGSLIGNTPLLYLPNVSSLLHNGARIYVKMESANPGGTGKDRAALSMISDAEGRGELPPPLGAGAGASEADGETSVHEGMHRAQHESISDIPLDVHSAIQVALRNSRTRGIVVEGTSGSTGISLASLCCSRGHGCVVVLPDDQSTQKVDFLRRLGCGVVVVQNCSISNPEHYVNVARRIWEWLQVERRYDDFYWENFVRGGVEGVNGVAGNASKRLIRAAFMDQFENPANVVSHYGTTGPEIHGQLDGKVDAFVMSAGTGGTLVGVGGYLKEQWWRNHSKQSDEQPSLPRIVLVDPPGSSLYNKVKFGVAYASQQSERRLRRHRYDTLAEGIGLDRVTANFGLGCEDVQWNGKDHDCKVVQKKIDELLKERAGAMGRSHDDQKRHTASRVAANNICQSKIIDDALAISDQQAVHMAHLLLRLEGLFVGSSTAMNLVGAIVVASQMPSGSNVVTVCCDGGQRHTSRFWNRDFIVNERGLVWPGDDTSLSDVATEQGKESILKLFGVNLPESSK